MSKIQLFNTRRQAIIFALFNLFLFGALLIYSLTHPETLYYLQVFYALAAVFYFILWIGDKSTTIKGGDTT